MRRATLIACLLAFALHGFVHAQQASVNTPVLPGAPTNPLDPTPLLTSDFVRQRQVEPDLIVSTRNAQHLMAVFNDYRAVDIAADGFSDNQYSSTGFKAFVGRMFAWVTGRPAKGQLPRHAAAVEASVGMARSTDGGLTWTGAMVPGSPDDHSQASLSSPIYGLDAMTDPKGAAGPCGYAYVVLVAFTRGGESRITVARWQDRNNKDGSEAWYYQGASVVETGLNSTNGQFHDLPSIVVDPLRVTGGDPCAHNVYVGWARFNGNAGASVLNFARATAGSSANWNPTWALRFVGSMDKTNQAVTLAVDPRPGTPPNGGGTLYYGWRAFKSPNSPDRYWMARSTNFGDTFEKAVIVTGTSAVYPYDQPSLSSDEVGPAQLAFRSNALPTVEVVPNAAVNPTGSTIYMAWQERVNMSSCPGSGCGSPDPSGEPKIVLTRSLDGKTWSPRTAVDIGNRDVVPPPNGLGYLPQLRQSGGQVMPRLSYGGGRLALFYYESRGPLTVIPPYGTVLAGLVRHLDARLALLDLVDGHLIGTSQVSRYLLKPFTDLSNGETVEDVVEVAPGVPAVNERVNVPNSGSGHIPFFGDYIGITPIVRLVPGAPGGPWRWAISPSDVPFQGFRTVFADSRNQIPPPGTPEQQVAQYPFYSPPKQNEPSCVNPGSRNHDVMHAVVNASVTLNAATTFKQNNIERAFPVTVGNPADVKRFYQLSLDRPDIASWTQSADVQNPEHSLLNVELFPFASSTRNAYLSATTATASVKVTVRELQLSGAQCTGDSQTLDNPLCTIAVLPTILGSMTLNLDPTNPPYEAGDGTTTTESHDPTLSDPVASSPFVSNPFVSNPFVSNPFVSNPFVSNPFVSNPFVSNATVYDITDLTWTVENGGNTTSSYFSRLNLGDLDQLAGNYAFQLLIYKRSYYAGVTNCEPVNVPFDQLISSVPNPFVSNIQIDNPFVSNPFVSNPFVSNPFVSNATFAEAPPSGGTGDFHDGTRHDYRPDQVLVTLRAYQLKPTAQLTTKFDPVDNPPSSVVHSHARNVVNGQKQGPPPFAIKGSDLVASGVFPAASVTAGFTVNVPQADVRNSGNLRSGTFRYGYYLSTDAVIDPKQDLLLAAGTLLPKLQPGETNTAGPADVTIPSTVAAGSYYYGIAFDDTGHVGETDETNNFVSAPLTVASLGTVDQQQPLIDAAAVQLPIGGATAGKVSQEVVAGLTRSLSNVLLPVTCSADATLTMQIQGVTNKGVPNGVVLSTTTFAGGSTSSAGGGFYDYPLAAPVPMVAGQKFSVVLSGATAGSCSIAQGPTMDPYKPGLAFSDSATVTPGVWDGLASKRDFPFKTLVK